MRAVKFTGAAIAAVIVVAALLLIIGIPSGFLTSEIQARVERETGYRLTIAGTTRIGVWPSLNVTLNDVTLQDPKDRDSSNRLTVGSIEANIALASLWSGHPQVTDLIIVRPVLSVPLLRERSGAPNPASKQATSSPREPVTDAPAIDHVTVTGGTVVFSNLRDRVDDHVDGINADIAIGADRNIRITGNARASEHPLKFDIKATAPAAPMERQNVPIELTLDIPDLLQAPLTGKAEVRLNGSIVMINGLSGAIGDAAFNGWASVDVASKPLVKLDLDFQRLDIAVSKIPATSGAQGSPGSQASQPWSNTSIDLNGLNYVDAQARVSAAAINIGDAHFAPAAIDATLAGGVLKAGVANLGVYGGLANGQLVVDASTASPAYTFSSDLVGVRALPLLRSAADFDKLDGKMQARIAVHSTGSSQRAIMSNLGGTVFTVFQDGAIKGLNVAQMIRSLTSNTLSGWQEGREQATDLTQLSASFRVEKGQATTGDLNLVGPLVKMTGAGTVDLGVKTLAFRVEPKLVMTTEGQGRATDPVGLGIPVVIDGSWAEPRIYPDMAGILDNPDAAYAKLKEMGKGLFGPGSGGLGGLLGGKAGTPGGSDGLGGLSGLLGGNSAAPGGNSAAPGGSGTAAGSSGSSNDPLGGNLGATLGNLIQQGLSQQGFGQQGPGQQGQGQNRNQGRNIAAPSSTPAPEAAAPPPSDPSPPLPPPQQSQDNQPMNDVLRQLFNR